MRSSLACVALTCAICSASAQQTPPQWNSGTSYIGGGLVRASDGNFYRCLRNNTAKNPLTDPHSYWELYYIRSNKVLTVAASGAVFSSLKTAWAMIQSARIASPATVQIKISAGAGSYSEDFATGMVLDHPEGSQITIVGDGVAKVRLNFNKSTDGGFIIDGGHVFGGIRGVALNGFGAAGNSNYGVHLDQGSNLLLLDASIDSFFYGVMVEHGSKVNVYYTSKITGFVYDGIAVLEQSSAECGGLLIDGQAAGGVGIECNYGSHAIANGTIIQNTTGIGFEADNESVLLAYNSFATNCVVGYEANDFSTIQARQTTSQSNSQFGYVVQSGGRIQVGNNTTSGNGADYNIALNAVQTDQSFIGP